MPPPGSGARHVDVALVPRELEALGRSDPRRPAGGGRLLRFLGVGYATRVTSPPRPAEGGDPGPPDRCPPHGARPPRGADPGTPERPDGPWVVLRTTGALFGALARARRDRSMHGPGIAFRCRLEMAPPSGFVRGAPFFERAADYDATVRFSRGIGLPQPFADLLGIAVRVERGHPGGGPQDLLVTSSGMRPGTRRLLLPARDGFFGQWFSSVLPYRIGDATTLIGVRATSTPTGTGTDFERLEATHRDGDLQFALALADGPGWTRVGTLRVGERLSDDEAAALSYDPWTTGPGVEPTGLMNRLRAAAYPGSRRARRALGPSRTGSTRVRGEGSTNV